MPSLSSKDIFLNKFFLHLTFQPTTRGARAAEASGRHGARAGHLAAGHQRRRRQRVNLNHDVGARPEPGVRPLPRRAGPHHEPRRLLQDVPGQGLQELQGVQRPRHRVDLQRLPQEPVSQYQLSFNLRFGTF